MPSRLRTSSSLDAPVAVDTISQPAASRPVKKQKMSLTQTYYVASTARSKLGAEARRADHNLRLLVGHANLLDSLMLELADAEREQEAWFNSSVQRATAKSSEPRHIQWIDTIAEEAIDDDGDESDADSDADSDIYEDATMFDIPLRRIRSPPLDLSSAALDYDESELDDEFDEEATDAALSLTRVASHLSPPELTLDSDSESEDESSMPSSPEQPAFELTAKETQAMVTGAAPGSNPTNGFFDQDFAMHQQRQPLIASC